MNINNNKKEKYLWTIVIIKINKHYVSSKKIAITIIIEIIKMIAIIVITMEIIMSATKMTINILLMITIT